MNCAIDMSVLEACEPTAPIGVPELTLISGWLDDFETDGTKRLAIDRSFRLWSDYERISSQNRAALALLKKLDTHLAVPVIAPAGGRPPVGDAWTHLDDHRTWLLAVALAPVAAVSIVNSMYLDWDKTRLPNTQPLPTVIQLLPAWIAERIRGLAPLALTGPYVPPPRRLSGLLAAAEPRGVGQNGRKAWEDGTNRYEWDYRHGRIEVYKLSDGAWVHEARADGTVIKTTGGEGRVWGR